MALDPGQPLRHRAVVPLTDVAPVMVDAVVAAEDRDFFSHGGLDPIAIGRAFVTNVRGAPMQGGSAITQAIKVEREWSKDEILERYAATSGHRR